MDYIETMPKITRDDQARAELESTGKGMKNKCGHSCSRTNRKLITYGGCHRRMHLSAERQEKYW